MSGNISIVSGKLEYNPSLIDTAKTKGNYVQLYNSGNFIGNKKIEIIGLTRRPNTANISISYDLNKKLGFIADTRYVGFQNDVYYNSEIGPMGALGIVSLENYALLDITVKYHFNKNINCILKIENVFGKKYEEIKGFTTKGRGIYLSLRYHL